MENKIKKAHNIILKERNRISITGIERVNLTSETAISVNLTEGHLVVSGQNLHVIKISVDEGVLEAEGRITDVRYADKKEKVSLLKRVFK